MKKLILSFLFLGLSIFTAHAGTIYVADFLTGDDVTVGHLQAFKNTTVNAINSADGALLQTGTVTAAKLDANANPENRWNEAFNDFVYSGLLAPTSATLSSTTTAGTAYVEGTRVVKDATAKTYTASKHTYVDLSNTGTYTYSEVAIQAAAPATAAHSIRLFRASTDTTAVNNVSDLRVMAVQLASNAKINDTAGTTFVDTAYTGLPNTILAHANGVEVLRQSSTATLINGNTSVTLDVAGSDALTLSSTAAAIIPDTTITGDLTVNGGANTFNDNGATDILTIDNDNVASALAITQDGILGSNAAAFSIISNADLDNNSYLLYIKNDNASSGGCYPVYIINDAATNSILVDNNANTDVINIDNAGSGNSIYDDSGAKLTAVGVWTDAPSFFHTKENVKEIKEFDSYLTKLDQLKMYNYQKKSEIYGSGLKIGDEWNFNYSKKVKPDAQYYDGFILDDPSTPADLVAYNTDGKIDGIDHQKVEAFLLNVNKALLNKVQDLEVRVKDLEAAIEELKNTVGG